MYSEHTVRMHAEQSPDSQIAETYQTTYRECIESIYTAHMVSRWKTYRECIAKMRGEQIPDNQVAETYSE